MTNPKAAIDTILEASKKLGAEEIKPLTLGRYALLELVGSPFIDKDTKFSTISLLPTFYVMTQDYKKLVGYNSTNIEELKQQAFEWAETKTIDDSALLVEELMRKFKLVSEVKPEDVKSEGENADKKKEEPPQTAG